MRDCRSPRRAALLFFRPGEVAGLTRPYPSQDRASRRRTAVRRQLQYRSQGPCRGTSTRTVSNHTSDARLAGIATTHGRLPRSPLLWHTASSSRFLSMERLRRRAALWIRREAPPIARTDLMGYQLGIVSVVLFVG